MLYRIWTKIRKGQIQTWDKGWVAHWDAAVAGSSALRAAVLTAFNDELAKYTAQEIGRMLWDMDKFYDTIDMLKLMERAMEMGYPILILALGLQMHFAPRFRGTTIMSTACYLQELSLQGAPRVRFLHAYSYTQCWIGYAHIRPSMGGSQARYSGLLLMISTILHMAGTRAN